MNFSPPSPFSLLEPSVIWSKRSCLESMDPPQSSIHHTRCGFQYSDGSSQNPLPSLSTPDPRQQETPIKLLGLLDFPFFYTVAFSHVSACVPPFSLLHLRFGITFFPPFPQLGPPASPFSGLYNMQVLPLIGGEVFAILLSSRGHPLLHY